MNNRFQVPEIGLRISEKAWRRASNGKNSLHTSFVGHVCTEESLKTYFPDRAGEKPNIEDAHRLATECLSRFWAIDRTCTAIVTNISMSLEDAALYLVRPAAEGAVTAGYGGEGGVPAFRCILKNGFFLAIGFEPDPYFREPGENDLVLTGPVYVQIPPQPGQALDKTRPPRSLPPDVLTAVGNLRSKRLYIANRVADWQSFLNWQKDLVRRRQLGLRYHAVEIDRTRQYLSFKIAIFPAELESLKKSRPFLAMAMPPSASKDTQRWDPIENARGIAVGELFAKRTNIVGPREYPEDETDKVLECAIVVQPDPNRWEECCRQIPHEGFLTSAIFMNLVPLQRQQTALTKLTRGYHANPRLADFLFEPKKAQVPDIPIVPQKNWENRRNLNKSQQFAVAKALAAQDLFLLQGPPGTGKTTVIAAICERAIRQGKRVLIASQANVAVDNVLARLAPSPGIRPVRVQNGREDDDELSDLSEQAVIYHWLSVVRNACIAIYQQGENLAADCERIEKTWPHLAEMIHRHQQLRVDRAELQRQLEAIEARSCILTEQIRQSKARASTLSVAVLALDQASDCLRKSGSPTDLGDWVRLIDNSKRSEMFGPLARWQEADPLPAVVSNLLTDRQDVQNSAAEKTGSFWLLDLSKRLFRRLTGQRRADCSESAGTEPNWSVEWIHSCRLLQQLRMLQSSLPEILSQCEELERLCAIARIRNIPSENWAQTTGLLSRLLKVLSGQSIAKALELGDIATSLRPKRQFARRLAKIRATLCEARQVTNTAADDLSGAVSFVTMAGLRYLQEKLRNANQQIEMTNSNLASLTSKAENLLQAGATIEESVSDQESEWCETIAALPDELREHTNAATLEIASDSLAVLDSARQTYTADIKDRLDRHRRWDQIQTEWIRLLQRLGRIDAQRLTPLYLKRCNVVGATCSACGKRRSLLGRADFARFDLVLVDEVSKATPPELLIPALFGEKLILVGDHRQLPPTFKEGRQLQQPYAELAEVDEDFEQVERFREMVTASLFKKLFHQAPNILKQALWEQHRMHPQIMAVVNQFYNNQLRCAIAEPDIKCDHGLTLCTHRGEFLSPANHVLWVDTTWDRRGRRIRERQVATSKANDTEAECVIRLVRMLNEAARQAGKAPGSLDIGVITFYGPQVKLIKQQLSRMEAAAKTFLDIRLNTVDSFQGAERSIIIVSLVRCKRGGLGEFARTYERINVAMSRARQLLIVLGSAETFARVDVPLPGPDGEMVDRRCYGHILDVVKRYGGMRTVRDLF